MVSQKEVMKVVSHPYEEIAHSLGFTLTGINLRVKPSSWLMVVKVQGRLDGAMVAFIETDTAYGCWEYLATVLYRTNAPLKWRKDKWG